MDFSVVASGTAPLRYQWRFNGQDVRNATNASLPLVNVQAANAGLYSVRVSNALGSVTSAEARLTVNLPISPPTITQQPQAQTVTAGAGVTFSVTAAGVAPLRYQWRFNASDLPGRTNMVLVLTNVQPAQAGSYTVEVSNAGGRVTSAAALLSLIQPPVITVQPQSQTVIAGTSVTFAVNATGVAPLRYQWRFNASDLPGRTNATLVLTNVQAANAGLYTVRVSNTGGSTLSAEARLGVNIPSVPPLVVRHPQSLTVAIGSNATFTVTATGTPPLLYQWRLDGRDLVGATNSILMLTNIQPANAGGYSVRVSNTGGSVTSAESRLTPGILPAITQPPQSQTAIAGTTVTFRVTATGTAPLFYQWRLEGRNLIGATNAVLVLQKVQTINAGNYSVRVSNVAGSAISSDARLVVASPPLISRQPQSQTLVAGSTVNFTVEATGTEPLRYQWRFNGRDLIGATNAGLILSNLQSTNAGAYSVRITNTVGFITSQDARLTLNLPPTIAQQPESRTAVPGENVAFLVRAVGTAPLAYQWLFEGRELLRATNSGLVITNVQSVSAGSYRVRVTNLAGSVISAEARLSVNTPPRIVTPPQNQTVIAGATATFGVVVTGTEPLRYQWRHNFRDLPRATNATLILTNVQAANAGGYLVAVANSAGVVTSREAILSVDQPPIIVNQPKEHSTFPGGQATFIVYAKGTLPLRYQWRFQGRDLPGATNATLLVANAQPQNTGAYRVEVRNAAGATLSEEARLLLKVPPQIQTHPANLTVPPGADATFRVVATGDAPLIYQWLKNGGRILGATNATFTLAAVQLTNSATYAVVVANRAGALTSQKASLQVSLARLTLADNFAASITNSLDTGSFDGGDNRIATREAGEPLHAGKRGGKTVWFTWLAPADGIATFSTQGSDFDTLLAIYTGDRVSNLREIASDDDRGTFKTSAVTFNAGRGTAYRIAIDGDAGAVGRILVSWRLQATLQRIPRIVSHPASQTVRIGNDVTLSVTAEASQPVAFQWFFNEARIPGATGTNLVLRNIRQPDAGRYTVKVSVELIGQFAFLTAESLPAILQINTGDPEPQKVAANDKFQDLVSAAGGNQIGLLRWPGPSSDAARLTVARGYSGSQVFSTSGASKDDGEPNHCDEIGGASQWFLYQAPTNGVLQISTEGSDFDTVVAVYTGPGTDFASLRMEACNDNAATNVQYSLVTLPVSSGINYYVAVDGVDGVQGQVELRYDLGLAPRITVQPLSLALVAGTNAALSVVAVNPLAAVPLAYQWKRDDADIAGAATATLGLTNIQPADAGNYSVVITNSFGSVTSAVASVTITVPVTITAAPQNQSVSAGGAAIFAVSASGTEPLTHQWLFNGAAIAGETNAVLTLADVQPANAGNYQVVVRNGAGSVTSPTANLAIRLPPLITAQPRGTNVVIGGTALLRVEASSAEPLSYQWQLNDANIDGATNASLTLANFQVTMAGDYSVIVSNSVASVISDSAIVAVSVPVAILSQPKNQNAPPGTNVTFHVAATGTAPLSYQWRLNGVNLPAATNATLTLANVQLAQAGAYDVVVRNAFSSVTSEDAALTLVGNVPVRLDFSPALTEAGFVIRLSGSSGMTVQLQVSSDLINWMTLTKLTLADEALEYLDTDAVNFSARFYRALSEP